MKCKYIHKLLSLCVVEVLIQKGFESVSNCSIHVLTDILLFYLEKITQKISKDSGNKEYIFKMLIENYYGMDNFRTLELYSFLKSQIVMVNSLKNKIGTKENLEEILKFTPKNVVKKQNLSDVILKDYNKENVKGLEVDNFMRKFIEDMDNLYVKMEEKIAYKNYNLEDNPVIYKERKIEPISKKDYLKILEEKKEELLQSDRYRTPYKTDLIDEIHILRTRMPQK